MKLTKEIAVCDICKSESNIISVNYPVFFYTEQTEGRPVKPYISQQKLDLCDKCLRKVTKITATGAMGYNEYNISN